MTHVSRFSVSACVLAIGVLIASSACAQTTQSRRHSAAPPKAGPPIQISGVVTDTSNGVRVGQAIVSYGDQTATTNGNGQFTLTLPTGAPISVSVQHPSFQPFQKSVTAQSGVQLSVALTELPSVTIKTTSNETHIVDIGTAQFAYGIIFSGFVRTDKGNFCKADGSDFTPDKTEFSRILGPAAPATQAACCQFGTVIATNVEMKSGAKLLVYFKDSCSGNEVDFVGREKATGLYQYFRFTEIAEIDFP